jgi:hypothetical protein
VQKVGTWHRILFLSRTSQSTSAASKLCSDLLCHQNLPCAHTRKHGSNPWCRMLDSLAIFRWEPGAWLCCAENGQCGWSPAPLGLGGGGARATHCNSWWRPHRAEIRRSHQPSPAATLSPGVYCSTWTRRTSDAGIMNINPKERQTVRLPCMRWRDCSS